MSKKAHQAQLPATPCLRTMSVTRLGVSAEKVVATIDTPSSHQGILRPERKNSLVDLPDPRLAHRPMASVTAKNRNTMIQSKEVNCIANGAG